MKGIVVDVPTHARDSLLRKAVVKLYNNIDNYPKSRKIMVTMSIPSFIDLVYYSVKHIIDIEGQLTLEQEVMINHIKNLDKIEPKDIEMAVALCCEIYGSGDESYWYETFPKFRKIYTREDWYERL